MEAHLVGGCGLHVHRIAQGCTVETQVSPGSHDSFVARVSDAFEKDYPGVVLSFPGPFHDLRPPALGIEQSRITVAGESEKTGLPVGRRLPVGCSAPGSLFVMNGRMVGSFGELEGLPVIEGLNSGVLTFTFAGPVAHQGGNHCNYLGFAAHMIWRRIGQSIVGVL